MKPSDCLNRRQKPSCSKFYHKLQRD